MRKGAAGTYVPDCYNRRKLNEITNLVRDANQRLAALQATLAEIPGLQALLDLTDFIEDGVRYQLTSIGEIYKFSATEAEPGVPPENE